MLGETVEVWEWKSNFFPHFAGHMLTYPWAQFRMKSSNGNILALLALCAGNSPITGEFPSQRPLTRNFDVFFDLRLTKRLSKQSCGWWSEMPLRSLWRHCNVTSIKHIQNTTMYNAVPHRRCGSYFQSIIFKLNLQNKGLGTRHKIAFGECHKISLLRS